MISAFNKRNYVIFIKSNTAIITILLCVSKNVARYYFRTLFFPGTFFQDTYYFRVHSFTGYFFFRVLYFLVFVFRLPSPRVSKSSLDLHDQRTKPHSRPRSAARAEPSRFRDLQFSRNSRHSPRSKTVFTKITTTACNNPTRAVDIRASKTGTVFYAAAAAAAAVVVRKKPYTRVRRRDVHTILHRNRTGGRTGDRNRRVEKDSAVRAPRPRIKN